MAIIGEGRVREIKFRAWDKGLREMFHFVKPDFCMEYGTLSFESVENPGICNFPDETDFANWELMQFTGLRDKNGKDIYEGDIVRAFDYGLSKNVLWDLTNYVGWVEQYLQWYLGIVPLHGHSEYEVIGNFHEHPELLK